MIDDELKLRRLRAEDDNTKVAPLDLLAIIESDLISGELKTTRMVVILQEPLPDGGWVQSTYRCGVTQEQELAAIVLAQHAHIDRWKQ